jgi:DNA primase
MNYSIYQGVIDQIRQSCSLVSIVSSQVKLTKKGHHYLGLCPFHGEKTPSFYVYESEGRYHCFGCGEHGDIFDYLQKNRHISFPEAVEFLAHQGGIPLPSKSDEHGDSQDKDRRALKKICEMACVWFEQQLKGQASAIDYLKKRGISERSIEKFRIGYAPRYGLYEYLAKEKVPFDLSVKAGLLGLSPKNNKPFDWFRERIIFPICDRQGAVIAFGGRLMGEGEPKYLNSPETPLFSKGNTLYGHHHSRNGKFPLVVCEGYMDVIALHETGDYRAVAPLGTSITLQHLENIFRLSSEPYFAFDGDVAGQKASFRALEKCLPLLKPDLSLKFLRLPSGDDPDSFLRKNSPEAWKDLLLRSQDTAEYLWHFLVNQNPEHHPQSYSKLEKQGYEMVDLIENKIVRENYKQDFRQRLWSHRSKKKSYKHQQPSLNSLFSQESKVSRHHMILLLLVIYHPWLLDENGETFVMLDYEEEPWESFKNNMISFFFENFPLEKSSWDRYICSMMESVCYKKIMEFKTLVPTHAPQTPHQAVLDTWKEAWRHIQHTRIHKDIDMCQKEFSQTGDRNVWLRLCQLRDLIKN